MHVSGLYVHVRLLVILGGVINQNTGYTSIIHCTLNIDFDCEARADDDIANTKALKKHFKIL